MDQELHNRLNLRSLDDTSFFTPDPTVVVLFQENDILFLKKSNGDVVQISELSGITGQQGPPGPRGLTGPQGPQGSQGFPGTNTTKIVYIHRTSYVYRDGEQARPDYIVKEIEYGEGYTPEGDEYIELDVWLKIKKFYEPTFTDEMLGVEYIEWVFTQLKITARDIVGYNGSLFVEINRETDEANLHLFTNICKKQNLEEAISTTEVYFTNSTNFWRPDYFKPEEEYNIRREPRGFKIGNIYFCMIEEMWKEWMEDIRLKQLTRLYWMLDLPMFY